MDPSKGWRWGRGGIDPRERLRWTVHVREAADGADAYSCQVSVGELARMVGRLLLDDRVQQVIAVRREHTIEARLAPAPAGMVTHGSLVVEPAARRVRVNGAPVGLTRREFDLLAFFVQNPDRVVSRRELVARLWDDAEELASQRTVDIHVRRLRRKLTRLAFPLETVVGVGYRFAPPSTRDERNGDAPGARCA
ncbi:MAG: winged helix-turn-helix domain-containing protein [Polyangiaceae bacterium]|jgi:DNA-binding response OmpR family regulator